MNAYIVFVNGTEQKERIAAASDSQALMIARAKYPIGHIKVFLSAME